MIQIFRRFFVFCGKTNKRKIQRSIVLGVLKALLEALKIPAIAVTLHGVLNHSLTMRHIALSFGIMFFSVMGNAIVNYCSTMLQCEAGYGSCTDKRIEIAEHLKYLPMGFFNQNSLGYGGKYKKEDAFVKRRRLKNAKGYTPFELLRKSSKGVYVFAKAFNGSKVFAACFTISAL